jgi:hypothetical protein
MDSWVEEWANKPTKGPGFELSAYYIQPWRKVYSFPRDTITNCHKQNGRKEQKFIFPQLSRPQLEITASMGTLPLNTLGENSSSFFQASDGPRPSWAWAASLQPLPPSLPCLLCASVSQISSCLYLTGTPFIGQGPS